jgi:hypothetical protein
VRAEGERPTIGGSVLEMHPLVGELLWSN